MIISVTRHRKIDHIDDYIVVMLAAKPNWSFPILMVKNQNKFKSTKGFFSFQNILILAKVLHNKCYFSEIATNIKNLESSSTSKSRRKFDSQNSIMALELFA